MNNVKLNGEQIEELEKLWKMGGKYICRTRYNDLVCYYGKPEKMQWSDGSIDWHEKHEAEHFVDGIFDFIKTEDEEPFYFGDMFEVVYKGEVE